MEITLSSPAEMQDFAERFVETLMPADSAVVVALSGELGAGKTTFTQAAAKQLGVAEIVQSPTFVLMKFYALAAKKFKQLIHIDCYRIEHSEELEVLGFKDLLKDPANLIIIEWPERVGELVPPSARRLNFTVTGDTERHVSYS